MSFQTKLLSTPGHYFRRKNGIVFVDGNQVWIEMPAFVRARSRTPTTLPSRLIFKIRPAMASDIYIMVGRDEEAKRVAQFPFPEIAPVQVENLDARVFAVADVNQIVIDRD